MNLAQKHNVSMHLGRYGLRKPLFKSPQQGERMQVINYLQNIQVEGMRKHLCFSCAFVTLYDKNNLPYKISRTHTLQQVKDIVGTIIKINTENAG